MSSRLPSNHPSMGCVGPPTTQPLAVPTAAIPSPLMCSLPSMVPTMNIGGTGNADHWSTVWATPPNAYHQYNYALNQSAALTAAAQALAVTPYMMNGFANQVWAHMPPVITSSQMNAYMAATNCADNQQQLLSHLNAIANQAQTVPSIHPSIYANNCDINQSGNSCPQQTSHNHNNNNNHNQSFDASRSQSSNRSTYTGHANNSHKSNSGKSIDRNSKHNNRHKRDFNYKSNHKYSERSKHNSKSNDRNSDYRSRYEESKSSIDRKSSDKLSSEPDLKKKRHSYSKLTTDESSPKRVANEVNKQRVNEKESSESPLPPKKEPNLLAAEAELIFTKPVDWTRCSPADLFYESQRDQSESMLATKRLIDLREKFCYELLDRSKRALHNKPKFELPVRMVRLKVPKPVTTSSDSLSCDTDSDDDDCEDTAYEELQRKKRHPLRLHEELWYNDPGEMNDGPLCRCSAKARKTGIRHGIYPGEDHLPRCDPNTNNRDRLYHYRVAITPTTNFLTKFPTMISHDGHEFVFEGYSLLSHWPLNNPIPCKVIRFNIEYTVTFVEEKFPVNFSVQDLDYFTRFVFTETLELVDLNFKAHCDDGADSCPRFHFLPRFSRLLDENGKELLSLNVVLQYLLASNQPVIDGSRLDEYKNMSDDEWQTFAKRLKGMIVSRPGMKPSSLRVDQIDRETDDLIDNQNQSINSTVTSDDQNKCDEPKVEQNECKSPSDGFPVVVHFGIRPPQLSYAGNPKYQKAWRDYVKFRHLLANKKKVSYVDKQTLLQKEEKLQEMRMKSDLKRDVTVVLSSQGFYSTGIQCDIIQHSLLLPVLVCHLRFHQSLQYLEGIIGYSFSDRYLLQLALTHPSYRENFGTNPDHARNALTNCGIRQPQYGDRRVHFMNTRKRGINMLINIMSRFGCNEETTSNINHNERLEFLGDAVVEFMSSIHLFFIFPDLEEGGLATYRAALVQNQQLAVLAKKLHLEKFMLYAHGSDLCHDLELRHAMANCFEALMGALFLDGGIQVADKVFSNTLFADERDLLNIWVNYPKHPLQSQEPTGDRHYIDTIPRLKELIRFEEITGIEFQHIRLLARAFTHRSVGFNNLTLGSNQRMEFLGDTVLQLVASEYLYKYFPEHHEGHLSLLRSSLVNNKTQAVVCDDLAMTSIAIYNYAKGELKTKDRADLLEAFLGALYVDKGLTYCRMFCEVCFFPRLEHFIMNQDWNDPKSKLQQCCLTLRSVDGGEPDIPVYKVIECRGPTNTRVYVVAVYFRDQRLATGTGHSIQEAEMNAASNALESSRELFPQLSHQKKVIERSVKSVKTQGKSSSSRESKRRDRRDKKSSDNHRNRREHRECRDSKDTKVKSKTKPNIVNNKITNNNNNE